MPENTPEIHRLTPEELGLRELQEYNPRNVKTVDDFMREIAKSSFEGGNMGKSVETFMEMVTDKDTFVVMTVSGAMTAAKMSLIMCEMVDLNMVQAVVSTGALMAHGLVVSAGMKHYEAPDNLTDEQLQDLEMNRIYTVLEPEGNFDKVEEIFDKVIDGMDPTKTFSSHVINREIGRYLHENTTDSGILKSCFEQGVPVFVPANSDSELGLNFQIGNDIRYHFNQKEINYNDFYDLTYFSELIVTQALRGKKLGIFTIGGGVPRNWAQQVGPYIESREKHLQDADPNYVPIKAPMYEYGMRITPEPVGLGGLSGCTYQEGKSWRKFVKDATTSEVLVDATVAWPAITQAAFQRLDFTPIKKDVFSGRVAVQKMDDYIRRRYPNAA